jgi:predicted nucleic acid-binding Zn ribbon protein
MNRRRPFNRAKWELARERFRIADYTPPAPDPGAPPLGAFVNDVLKGMKLSAHAQVSQIAAAWPDLVGPQLAANTRPGHIENKLLTVFVSHPAWLMELRGAPAAEILSRLQDHFGKSEIKNIRWSIDPGQAPR